MEGRTVEGRTQSDQQAGQGATAVGMQREQGHQEYLKRTWHDVTGGLHEEEERVLAHEGASEGEGVWRRTSLTCSYKSVTCNCKS